MDVTDVLRDRVSEPGGFERMAALSAVAHGALIALVLLAPGRWWRWPENAPPPRTVMTIMLGGAAAGPESGGLTAAGGRPVQAVAPPQAPRREAQRPPAAKTPEMTLPSPKARPAEPKPLVTEAPEEARGRTPARGAELAPGEAIADTTARGQGFGGLSTGGAAGSGSYLDVANFCCPDYIALMTERIRANWRPQAEFSGETVVKFTILRDGRLTAVALERSSGYSVLDITAQRAVYTTRQLPPLPSAFPEATLTVHLNFQYQR